MHGENRGTLIATVR